MAFLSVSVKKVYKKTGVFFTPRFEYIICYAKNASWTA